MEYITYIFSIILWKMQVESLVVFPDRYYSYMMPGTNIFTSTKKPQYKLRLSVVFIITSSYGW
ncbi:hypothetical protein B6U41_08130 [Ligilactobacillus salivarius]|uniref:hypothetical protein n=1 Tax=Ligilactobacillus salivarius TaxID=1624 RepID=UPI0009DB0C6E|nr:hypothetical protein [Ligilactobacillus salivarius]OQR15768.1 hypothetical protein B6U41_08130 [Ligilactobacillus salivarius]